MISFIHLNQSFFMSYKHVLNGTDWWADIAKKWMVEIISGHNQLGWFNFQRALFKSYRNFIHFKIYICNVNNPQLNYKIISEQKVIHYYKIFHPSLIMFLVFSVPILKYMYMEMRTITNKRLLCIATKSLLFKWNWHTKYSGKCLSYNIQDKQTSQFNMQIKSTHSSTRQWFSLHLIYFSIFMLYSSYQPPLSLICNLI